MADYCVWNLCNSNCIMCTNPQGFRNREDAKDYSADKVLKRILSEKDKLVKSGVDINLTGGEPTIHPEFIYLLENLRKEFPNNTIAFASNGRRLAYGKFTRKLLKINNLRLHVVVHSAESKIHNGITRVPDSYEQTVKGLENLFKYKNGTHTVELRTVLLQQNYKKIDELYEMLYKKFPSADRVSTIFPEYEGRAETNFEQVKITFLEVRPHIEDSLEKWGKKFRNFYLYHFPLCVINSDFWEHVIRSLPPDHHETFFMDKCEDCFYKDSCLGVYKDYVRHFGKDHFKPIEKKIAGIEKNREDYHRPIIKN